VNYESDAQWTCRTGNTKGVGEGHVSIYLVLMDSSSLPADWEVNAIANFSAYNFIDDEYVTTQGTVVVHKFQIYQHFTLACSN